MSSLTSEGARDVSDPSSATDFDRWLSAAEVLVRATRWPDWPGRVVRVPSPLAAAQTMWSLDSLAWSNGDKWRPISAVPHLPNLLGHRNRSPWSAALEAFASQQDSQFVEWTAMTRVVCDMCLNDLATSVPVADLRTMGWWWIRTDCVIVSDLPAILHTDGAGELHCDGGPAIGWSDFQLYFWHGRHVPSWLVTEKYTPKWALNLTNTELRRCAFERLGWTRVTAELGHVVGFTEDPANPGRMLELWDVQGLGNRLLLCENASEERDGTRRRYGLHVPMRFKDPVAAAAWTFGVRRADYLTLNRAT
jgi:hypothetical protein